MRENMVRSNGYSVHIEITGLDPYENQAILIGMKRKGEIKQWKLWEMGDEAGMILLVVEEIKKTDETIVGYNNLKFDVPFMVKRLEILGGSSRELRALRKSLNECKHILTAGTNNILKKEEYRPPPPDGEKLRKEDQIEWL